VWIPESTLLSLQLLRQHCRPLVLVDSLFHVHILCALSCGCRPHVRMHYRPFVLLLLLFVLAIQSPRSQAPAFSMHIIPYGVQCYQQVYLRPFHLQFIKMKLEGGTSFRLPIVTFLCKALVERLHKMEGLSQQSMKVEFKHLDSTKYGNYNIIASIWSSSKNRMSKA